MATIQASDVLPVRSRISWGAVMAGAVVALAIYVLFMAAGVALGLTVAGQIEGDTMGISAGIWSTVAMLLSLFAGGFVASRISVGENTSEAAVYGIVVWGVVFVLLMALTAGAINTGLNALTGASTAAAAATNQLSEADLREAGLTPEQIERARARLRDRLTPTDEQMRTARERSAAAAWWAFAGLALSMAAAVGGAILGAGPNMVITSLRVRAAVVTTTPAEQEASIR